MLKEEDLILMNSTTTSFQSIPNSENENGPIHVPMVPDDDEEEEEEDAQTALLFLSELWQQQLQIIEDTTMPITTCTHDEEENDSVGNRSPHAIPPMHEYTKEEHHLGEEHHHLWWGDGDHVAAPVADKEEEDHLNDTLPLFALNLEDTTTTSGATDERNHDSDHLDEEDFDVDVFGTDMDEFLEEYDDYSDWFLNHAPPLHLPTIFVVWVTNALQCFVRQHCSRQWHHQYYIWYVRSI
jgi:hypothetical protein